MSADYQITGLRNAVAATGNNGWVGDVSSNLFLDSSSNVSSATTASRERVAASMLLTSFVFTAGPLRFARQEGDS